MTLLAPTCRRANQGCDLTTGPSPLVFAIHLMPSSEDGSRRAVDQVLYHISSNGAVVFSPELDAAAHG